MTMQTSTGVALEFFDPTAPQKASSPALLFGYEMILSIFGGGEVNADLLERVERIERELEGRGLLGAFRTMLERDRQEQRSFKPGSGQHPQPTGMLPQDAPSEQVLYLYRQLAQKIVEVKRTEDASAFYQLEAHFELVKQEMHRRALWPILEQLDEADTKRGRVKAHEAN